MRTDIVSLRMYVLTRRGTFQHHSDILLWFLLETMTETHHNEEWMQDPQQSIQREEPEIYLHHYYA